MVGRLGSHWVGGASGRSCSCHKRDGVSGETVRATGVLTLTGGVVTILKNINKIGLLSVHTEEREREREREREMERERESNKYTWTEQAMNTSDDATR